MDEGDQVVCNYASKRFDIFCEQNFEAGHFDVIFEFVNHDKLVGQSSNDNDDTSLRQQLYAHSFILWPLSNVFEQMFFGPFDKHSVITIERHEFKDFIEFITFLYSGFCDIDEDNVMALLDLAEYYQIQELKDVCDAFLSLHPFTIENILTVYESLKLYNTVQDGMLNISKLISTNAAEILKSNEFMNAKMETVLDIVKMDDLKVCEEDLFKAIMEWARTGNASEEDIKLRLKDILPFIRFPIMNMDFLLAHVVPKGYIFSSFEELSQVLRDAAAFAQKESSTKKYSKYSNKLRQGLDYGRKIQFRDSAGNKAFAYIQNPKVISAIQKASIGKKHGALTWDFDVPEICVDRIKTYVYDCQFYVIWEDYRLVLKDYKATQPFYRKDFDDELWFFKNFQVLAPLIMGNPGFNLNDHNITVKIV